jgi:hypothetical protein
MVEKLAHIKQILLAEQPNMTNTAEKSVVINKINLISNMPVVYVIGGYP